jgi:predicted dehydrogenase
MSETLRVGVLGLGFAGLAHARGYAAAGGYKIDCACDLIPARVDAFAREFPGVRIAESAEAMVKDPGVDVLSICLPTDQHALWALKALRAKKHVILESPPTLNAKEMRALVRAAEKSGKALLPAFPRRFGLHEAAARQAIEKGYVGAAYHARATWLRPSGIPQGTRNPGEATGWYVNPARSGGGAMLDLGLPLLELAWGLMGSPRPVSVMAVGHSELAKLAVEESGVALVKFEGGQTLELSAGWAIRAAPSQYGLTCRVHGTEGAVDVYTPDGATLYRGDPDKPKATVLKGPKTLHHAAVMRQLKLMIKENTLLGEAQRAMTLMRVVEGVYKSARSGRSVDVTE